MQPPNPYYDDILNGWTGNGHDCHDSFARSNVPGSGGKELLYAAANDTWSEGNLDAAGLAAINKTGTTQFRVYFNLDDNDDGGNDYLGYYGGNHSSSANRPQLVVTYQ